MRARLLLSSLVFVLVCAGCSSDSGQGGRAIGVSPSSDVLAPAAPPGGSLPPEPKPTTPSTVRSPVVPPTVASTTVTPLPKPADFPAVDVHTPGPEGGRRCPSDTKYFDEDPAGLQPEVIVAWRQVERDANAQGLLVCLNDGKRSAAQQQAQYDKYVAKYGQAAANELVLPPDKSAHVSGWAIDVQPAGAYRWLEATKGSIGLCRIYQNEPWHFEYRAEYRTAGCPEMLPKPQR